MLPSGIRYSEAHVVARIQSHIEKPPHKRTHGSTWRKHLETPSLYILGNMVPLQKNHTEVTGIEPGTC